MAMMNINIVDRDTRKVLIDCLKRLEVGVCLVVESGLDKVDNVAVEN